MAPNPQPDERDRADELELAQLARLRAGDRAAFAALVERHAASLLRVALGLLGNRATAEEVVQETWLGLLTGLDGFEGRSSLRTWLFKILVNRARSHFDREGRTVPFSALGDEIDGVDAIDRELFDERGRWRAPPAALQRADPEQLAFGAEARVALQAALEELPPAQRTVVTLRDVEGLDTVEICNILAISATNQRVLLHRARAKLRRTLERLLGGAS
jgi:RNA polymerase sigma-70 factor (ECF subfamily)